MEIDVLHVPDCPNRGPARTHLDRALAQTGLQAVVREHEVGTSEEAARFGMTGSPTILIDGRDPFATTTGPAALACRLYRSEAGVTGAPTVDQLIAVLAASQDTSVHTAGSADGTSSARSTLPEDG